MALRGCCCCCGLRGGAKSVGVLFLVVTLLQVIGVIAAWVVLTAWPTRSEGFGFDTPDGRFGVSMRETHSVLGGRGGDISLDLGPFGGSISSGSISVRTSKGSFSSSDLPSQFTGQRSREPSKETYLIPSTVYVLLSLLFNSMLIHGVDHDSTCAVLAWLVYYGAVFVLTVIGSLGALIACGVLASSHGADATLGLLCGIAGGTGLVLSALLWYWWAVVLAFERQIRAGAGGFKYQREVTLQEQPYPPQAAMQAAEARA